MAKEVVAHMIGNAHLDPVWLWHWERGSDEAVATCRAACDLLDDYPEATFSRGEAWVYRQVYELDRGLFERIKKHVDSGRWEVVNGWWVQADVNLTTEEAILKSIELGHAWLREHLGIKGIEVAYNVDSFGHGAYLPRILNQAGQKYYVMMRPGPHEMAFPANLFRWRSPDGYEALTYRIDSYVNPRPDMQRYIEWAIKNGSGGTGHAMCFYGVGDHGGGPTRESVEWILAHRDFAPGVRLEFSTCARFFAAVEGDRNTRPELTGELNPHAVGCYSVCGELKREIRRAELAAIDAERLMKGSEHDNETGRGRLREAWEQICFNQFHDIFPGSAVRSAIASARDDVASARKMIERTAYMVLRTDKRFAAGCEMQGHRIHAVNRTERAWKGLAECEVWFDWRAWEHHLEDAKGDVVPCQKVEPESLSMDKGMIPIPRLVFPLQLGPLGHSAVRIVKGTRAEQPGGPRFEEGKLTNGLVTVGFGSEGITSVVASGSGREMLGEAVKFICLEDNSDTWGHCIARFEGAVRGVATFGAPVEVERGALRTTVRMDGKVGGTEVMLWVSLHRGEPVVYMRMQTNYRERLTVLKMSVAPRGGVRTRRDRVGGGWVERATNGNEHPLQHGMVVGGESEKIGIVLPDTFAADCTETSANVTIIRNNLNAWHNAGKAPLDEAGRHVEMFGSDEGPQTLRMALALEELASEEGVEKELVTLQRPPHVWDDYRGGARLDRFNVIEEGR